MRRCTLRPRALRGHLAPTWPALPLPRAEAAKTRGLTDPPHRVLKVQRDYVSVPQRHGTRAARVPRRTKRAKSTPRRPNCRKITAQSLFFKPRYMVITLILDTVQPDHT
eukprot:scaffold100768_cov61-Phaeocystis_antarctica.AAC.3